MVISTVLGVSPPSGWSGQLPGKGRSPGISPLADDRALCGDSPGHVLFFWTMEARWNPWALLLSHICVATPLVIVIVSATLQDFNRSWNRPLRSWGYSASDLHQGDTSHHPAGIISGALFAFIVSFDEVVIAAFIGGYRSATLQSGCSIMSVTRWSDVALSRPYWSA